MVERGDVVEVGEDLVAQRRLGRLVGLELGVEAQLEVAHELGGDRRVRDQHVVLVALGEARADALAVLAVGAQDRDLAAVQPGGDHEPVERCRSRPRRGGRRRAVRPRARRGLEVERLAVRAEHAELLHPGLVVAAVSRVEISSITRSPRSSSIGSASPSSTLPPALVERRRAWCLAQRLQRDHERLAGVASRAKQLDVVRPRSPAPCSPCSARAGAAPSSARQQRAPARAVALDQHVAQLVVPRARELHDLAPRARGCRARAARRRRGRGSARARASPSSSTCWASTSSVSKRRGTARGRARRSAPS